MTNFTHEARELNIGELDAVNGGDMMGMVIDAAEKYLQALGQRVLGAVHQPITTPQSPMHF